MNSGNPLDLSVSVGILVRNCESALLCNIPKVEDLCSRFKTGYIAIYENNSTDNSKQVLRDWKLNSKYQIYLLSEDLIYSKPIIEEKYPSKGISRISRMVDCRNKLQVLLSEFHTDITVLIDIDIQSFDVDEICRCIIDAPNDWGALFANSSILRNKFGKLERVPLQYDSYAIVGGNEDPMKFSRWNLTSLESIVRARFFDYLLQKTDYLPVTSAFGGLGIYKSELLSNMNYEVIIPQRWQKFKTVLCEHYSVNKKIVESGHRCYICKGLNVIYHTIIKSGFKGLLLAMCPTLYCMLVSLQFRRL